MLYPTSAFTVVSIIVFLIPGLVWALVRTTLRGFRADDKGLDTRVAQALIVSVVLDAIYLLIGHDALSDAKLFTLDKVGITIEQPLALSIVVLVGAVVIPAALAGLVYSPFKLRWRPKWVDRARSRLHKVFERTVRYTAHPTSWDFGATPSRWRMVRVQLKDGRWIGGFYGPDSYVSTYPEPRDMFIRYQYKMNADGSFAGPIEGTAGVWLLIADDSIVEWLEPPYTDEERKELNA